MNSLTSSSLVDVVTKENVTEITLRRGDKANALSVELVDELSAALKQALDGVAALPADSTSPIIVFRSDGKNFCAGFDLSTLESETDASLIVRLEKLEILLQTIYHAPCATIALVQGGAFGAGFDLAMACDYRLATADARFRMPGWRMGLALGTRRTCARVGQEIAFDFLRSASIIDAALALEKTFITEIANAVTWPRGVEEIAQSVSALPSQSYARLKRIVLADTRIADMQDLLDSLRKTPLKPRMQQYVESRNSSK
jgi:enoyl-CoA hydratase/carnithine racemase